MYWKKCLCDNYWCTLHSCHVHSCSCPPIEEWTTDPYIYEKEKTCSATITMLEKQENG